MSIYISEIKRIAAEKGIKLKHIAQTINMTEAGFHHAIKNNTLKIEKLFQICEVLEISPGDLLNKEVDNIRVEKPGYGRNQKEMIEEVLSTLKRIESKLFN